MEIDQHSWKQHALSNRIQTVLLLIVMGSFMLLLGFLLWGLEGILILAVTGGILLMFNPRITPQVIMRMYRATPLSEQQAPLLVHAIRELSIRAGLNSLPSLYYIPSGTLNAFSVGSSGNASIGMTDGLLRKLNIDEIVAVLAHEISHIHNNDMGVMGLADMFSRLTRFLSLFGQLLLLFNLPMIFLSGMTINWFAIGLLIFSPNICALAQLGLSRTREYNADLNAVRLIGDPQILANALVKIEQIQGGWLEQIFLPGRRVPEPSLLRTHPPTSERVRRLMELKIPDSLLPLQSNLDQDTLNRFLRSRSIRRRPKRHINGLWH